MPGRLEPQKQLDFATDYLYNRWGLKIAKVSGRGVAGEVAKMEVVIDCDCCHGAD